MSRQLLECYLMGDSAKIGDSPKLEEAISRQQQPRREVGNSLDALVQTAGDFLDEVTASVRGFDPHISGGLALAAARPHDEKFVAQTTAIPDSDYNNNYVEHSADMQQIGAVLADYVRNVEDMPESAVTDISPTCTPVLEGLQARDSVISYDNW